MAENVVQAISKVDSEGLSRSESIYQLFRNYEFADPNTSAANSNNGAAASGATNGTAGAVKQAQQYRAEKVEEKPVQTKLPVTGSDVFLKFSVNEETNAGTVYIVDRASRKILRSIPPDEVNRMKPGDLLKLLA
jgi:uncharacterized FlaG/YvyC family protein